MEAVVTSLSLPPGSRLGFGVMVRINGDDYILSFGQENSDKNLLNFNNEFQQLRSLKVNDKIIIKSHWCIARAQVFISNSIGRLCRTR